MHVNERFEAYQVKKNLKKLEETLRKKFGVSERGLGGEKTKLSRKRSREMKTESHRTYIQRFNKSRQIEVSRHLSSQVSRKQNVDRCSYRGSIEGQINKRLKEARSIPQLSRSYRGSKRNLDQSTQLSRSYRDCDKRKMKSSIDSQVSRRCRDCLKTVFQEGKNTDMNAIKHATQPRIQTAF